MVICVVSGVTSDRPVQSFRNEDVLVCLYELSPTCRSNPLRRGERGCHDNSDYLFMDLHDSHGHIFRLDLKNLIPEALAAACQLQQEQNKNTHACIQFIRWLLSPAWRRALTTSSSPGWMERAANSALILRQGTLAFLLRFRFFSLSLSVLTPSSSRSLPLRFPRCCSATAQRGLNLCRILKCLLQSSRA